MKQLGFSLLTIAAMTVVSPATATIVEDFQFNDPNGTVITDAVNSANPGNNFLSQNTNINAGVLNGSFRIQKDDPVGQVGNTFDIANTASGKVWLVAEIAGWISEPVRSSIGQRVRLGFLDNDPPTAGSSTITAEMTIDRIDDDTVQLRGGALGSGSNLTETLDLTLDRSTPLTIALELDKTANLYSIYYQDDGNPYQLLGTNSVDPGRDGNSVRFAFTGTYSDGGAFFDVGRIYVTTTNPIPEPSGLLLTLLAALGLIARCRVVAR